MWLTLIIPDLCNCTSIYTAPPPLAPADPLASPCNCLHNAMSWRWWSSKQWDNPPCHQRW